MPGGPRPDPAPTHRLTDVLDRLRAAGAQPELLPGGGDQAATPLHGISLSSRTVRPGDLYAALPGLVTHGARYAGAAVDAGACAVLTDADGAALLPTTGREVPVVVVPGPRGLLGDLAAWFYGHPAERMTTFGVTGTNGKTTTTFLLDAALRALGRTTGLVGTVQIRVGDTTVSSTGTTPEAPDLHALLAVMVQAGVQATSMEISSHALDQHRVDGLVVDLAAFTNLSQDHLDYHRTMEAYFAAKAALFTPRHARAGVVCVDDAWGRRLAEQAQIPVVTVATSPGAAADWTVGARRVEAGLPVVQVGGPQGEVTLHCPLPGDFNVANTLVALALLTGAGVDPASAARALAAAPPVPGRMERVAGSGTGGAPVVVVDYAHTPDAVAASLGSLRDAGHPLVVVLGAGGDRDRDKREKMGAAAARAADLVVVTDDNPRSEDPAAIRAAVLAGALKAVTDGAPAEVVEVADRHEAVVRAVAAAGSGGVVLLAGKGHEQGQEVAGRVLPFDDRQVARNALTAGTRPSSGTPTSTEETPA